MASGSLVWKFAVGSLLKALPLVGQTLSVLTSPIIAGAMTYALGQVFNRHFASGGRSYRSTLSSRGATSSRCSRPG